MSSSLPRKSGDDVGFPQSSEEFACWGADAGKGGSGGILLGQRTLSAAHPPAESPFAHFLHGDSR